LYALFQGSGTFFVSGATIKLFTAPGGLLQVFTDPSTDTTFSSPPNGATPFSVANNSDDILIASGAALAGEGTLDPTLSTCAGGGINCGSFGSTTSFGLTPAGMTYFTAPVPFYDFSFHSGQYNNFTPSGTQTINGSMDVIFASVFDPGLFGRLPEPTTLALLSGALAVFGIAGRRRPKHLS
jgi:hypothetical protein